MSRKIAKRKEHALVIGGSMAGLLAARVLSDHFQHVTILERDAVHDRPESRRAQPQTRHLHALLDSGFRICKHLFPDLEKTLIEHDAILADFGDVARWYQFDGYKVQAPSGHTIVLASRPFLEWHIRREVLALPNVFLRTSCEAKEPLVSPDGETITGVRVNRCDEVDSGQTVLADLVVDACGRGSPTLKWLTRLGFEPPPQQEVKVNVGYATRLYERRPGHLKGAKLVMISPTPPGGKRMAYLFPIEEDRWIVTAGGWVGDYPPGDEEGFLEFIQSLPIPDIYTIIRQAQPRSDIVIHRFPSNLRRHYEQLKRFPTGYLVIGDAIASFNPVYGQGMSSAALQVRILNDVVGQESLDDMWKMYFQRIAKVIDRPWNLTVGEDFRYPETEGQKSPTMGLVNRYVAMVHRATHSDPAVYQQFLNVSNLLAPPESLLYPRILWRVIRHRFRHNTQ